MKTRATKKPADNQQTLPFGQNLRQKKLLGQNKPTSKAEDSPLHLRTSEDEVVVLSAKNPLAGKPTCQRTLGFISQSQDVVKEELPFGFVAS